jgi:Protein of unknown function (DUF3553)
MTSAEWKMGDRVIHAGRPEWGVGEVRGAESTSQDGKRCQRLTIRFERAGVKTLTTAFAELRSADDSVALRDVAAAERADEHGWLGAAEAEKPEERMTTLPEGATDPFRTKRARLEATLGLYRFTAGGSSLVDWAAMQSGLKDPLSRFNRHELEKFFERFKNALDAHLRRLVFEMRKDDPAGMAEVAAAASPQARQALKRADTGR